MRLSASLIPSWLLTPQSLEPRGVGGRVANGVLDVAVPQVILDQAGVCALVGQRKTTGVPEHVRMRSEGQRCGAAGGLEQQVHR